MAQRFVAFARDVLGIELTDAQRAWCSIAWDRESPSTLPAPYSFVGRSMLGGVDVIPDAARRTCVAAFGRGSGKSRLAAARLLHRALTADCSRLAPGERGFCIVVGPRLSEARQTLSFASGAIHSVPSIAELVESETGDAITLRRPDGKRVVIECAPASAGGVSLRGRTLLEVCLEECAFHHDEEHIINDRETYEAAMPRLVADGTMTLISTPWGAGGLFYTLFRENFGSPTTAIAMRGPTTLLRPDDLTRQEVERARARDPKRAALEYDADFSATSGGRAFPEDAITDAFADPGELWALTAPIIAIDPSALKGGDLFSYVAAQWVERPPVERHVGARVIGDGIVTCDPILERAGGEFLSVFGCVSVDTSQGRHRMTAHVCDEIAGFAKSIGARLVVSDQFESGGLESLFADRGLKFRSLPDTSTSKSENVGRLRRLLVDRQILIEPHDGLRRDLLGFETRPKIGGGWTFGGRGAGHFDALSALLHAIAAEREGLISGSPHRRKYETVHYTPPW